MDMHPFQTSRLDVRPMAAGDEALYCRLYSDPEVMRHIGAPLAAEAAARAFAMALRLADQPDPRLRAWVLSERAIGEGIGILALSGRASEDALELGAMLLPQGQGRGFAGEAQGALLDRLFATTRVDMIWSRNSVGNEGAIRVRVKLGFLRTPAAGDSATIIRWQISRERWLALRQRSGGSGGMTRGTVDCPMNVDLSGGQMQQSGSLACVGLGMMLGAHLSPRSRSHIDRADVVFGLVSDPLVELWLQQMRPDARSLQPYYREGKSRQNTYHEMVEAMLVEVRAGHDVCGVFYGHPGVFALVPHKVIENARKEGFPAHMEPGISAEDCLYADLGIDPGTYGCQHYEASQFMFYQRRIDPSAYLVLWQIGIAGDRSLARFSTGAEYRRLLVDLLLEDYPASHEVIAYEAATLPITAPRMGRMPLSEIVSTELHPHTTLVIPPSRPMRRNQDMLDRVAQLDLEFSGSAGVAVAPG